MRDIKKGIRKARECAQAYRRWLILARARGLYGEFCKKERPPVHSAEGWMSRRDLTSDIIDRFFCKLPNSHEFGFVLAPNVNHALVLLECCEVRKRRLVS